MEETIHISFKERRKDAIQKVADVEDEMENLFLNDNAQHQQTFQIATRDVNDYSDLPIHHHVSDTFMKTQMIHPSREDTLELEI